MQAVAITILAIFTCVTCLPTLEKDQSCLAMTAEKLKQIKIAEKQISELLLKIEKQIGDIIITDVTVNINRYTDEEAKKDLNLVVSVNYCDDIVDKPESFLEDVYFTESSERDVVEVRKESQEESNSAESKETTEKSNEIASKSNTFQKSKQASAVYKQTSEKSKQTSAVYKQTSEKSKQASEVSKQASEKFKQASEVSKQTIEKFKQASENFNKVNRKEARSEECTIGSEESADDEEDDSNDDDDETSGDDESVSEEQNDTAESVTNTKKDVGDNSGKAETNTRTKSDWKPKFEITTIQLNDAELKKVTEMERRRGKWRPFFVIQKNTGQREIKFF